MIDFSFKESFVIRGWSVLVALISPVCIWLLLLPLNGNMSTKQQNNVEINEGFLYNGFMISREQIHFGLIAGDLTAKDVAEATGVSARSISNMLKPKPKHKPNESTIKTVLDFIAEAMKRRGWRFNEFSVEPIPKEPEEEADE